MSSNYPQLKIAARARVFTNAVLMSLLVILPLFSLFTPSSTRAAATISKTLTRPINEIGLVGWWTFDGPQMLTNVADTSGQGDNGNLILGASGNTATTTAPGKVGQALQFDGIDDYATMGASYNGVQTVSFWMRVATSTTLQKIIDLNGTATVTIDSGTLNGNNFTSPTRYVDGAAASTFNDTSWHHVAITTGTGINASALDIGRISAGYLGGSLDDVRIYNRTLSAAEVERLYKIGATSKISKTLQGRDSLTSGLIGWWTFDGPDMLTNVADSSGQGNTGKLVNMSTTTAPGKVGQALQFDGTNDYVDVNTAVVSAPPFSFSAWMKFTSVGASVMTIVSIADKTQDTDYARIYIGTNGVACVGIRDTTDVETETCGTTDLRSSWHHVVGVYSATNNRQLYRL
jgi:hypothetical protein